MEYKKFQPHSRISQKHIQASRNTFSDSRQPSFPAEAKPTSRATFQSFNSREYQLAEAKEETIETLEISDDESIKSKEERATTSFSNKNMSLPQKEEQFEVGTLVEARYRGKSKYYQGKISRKRFNGSYDILYDDGEREMGVAKHLIRVREGVKPLSSVTAVNEVPVVESRDENNSGSTLDPSEIHRGSIVQCKSSKDGKMVEGKVMRKRPNGSFDLMCNDGNKQFGEMAVSIDRLSLSPSTSSRSMDLSRSSSTKEHITSPPMIQNMANVNNKIEEEDTLEIGSVVEARYRGREKYYSGKITKKRFDGTYDILYDDGERELCVARQLIRLKDKSIAPSNSQSHSKHSTPSRDQSLTSMMKVKNQTTRKAFEIGDEIEARYKGKSKYYPGKISRVRFDGSYDIMYEDGDREIGVSKDLVRPREVKEEFKQQAHLNQEDEEHEGKKKFSIGDEVEVRYKGKSKFYPGKISRSRFDGTYDVLYNDGDRELGVSKEMIRPKSTLEHEIIKSPLQTKEPKEKMEVEEENSLSDFEENIEQVESFPMRNEEPKKGGVVFTSFTVGALVQAKYHGRGKYYDGKISKVHADGTLDIDYDDGDKDLNLEQRFVKLQEVPVQNSADVNTSSIEPNKSSSIGTNETLRSPEKVVQAGKEEAMKEEVIPFEGEPLAPSNNLETIQSENVNVEVKTSDLITSTAKATITFPPRSMKALLDANYQQSIFAMARAAGLLGAKKTQDLIPSSFGTIEEVVVDVKLEGKKGIIVCNVKGMKKMKTAAITGATIAALSIVDEMKEYNQLKFEVE
ncbi:hypothetical protein CTEN210_00396 [Chaetoceros tenuissimus]|uniref:Tudor domain-containing protein n=1 Tax=Chaetoceros tenuissimus TaxID=426638 RepID=A0AAD3GYD0_9STRA|nr:hypothetical protein CTEN210_00396 [Chaetoceros tenuissimus]